MRQKKIRIDIVRKLGLIVCGMCVVSIGAVYLGIMRRRRRRHVCGPHAVYRFYIFQSTIATMYYYH